MPGRGEIATLPSTTFAPSKMSFEMSRAPSRSAQSTMGERCDAAEMPHEVSVMQPSITFMPSARASCSIFCASRMPVDFISLMLMPL